MYYYETETHIVGDAYLYYGFDKFRETKSPLYEKGKKHPFLLEKISKTLQGIQLQTQIIIYKDQGIPTEILFLYKDVPIDISSEIFSQGLDHIEVSVPWDGTLERAYRWANGKELKPIGRIYWKGPDLFTWTKKKN